MYKIKIKLKSSECNIDQPQRCLFVNFKKSGCATQIINNKSVLGIRFYRVLNRAKNGLGLQTGFTFKINKQTQIINDKVNIITVMFHLNQRCLVSCFLISSNQDTLPISAMKLILSFIPFIKPVIPSDLEIRDYKKDSCCHLNKRSCGCK